MTGNFQQCGMCDQQCLRSDCAYAQSDQSLCKSLEYSLTVNLLTEHHLEFISLKGGCTGRSKCHIVGNHMSQLICVDRVMSLLSQLHAQCSLFAWRCVSSSINIPDTKHLVYFLIYFLMFIFVHFITV